MSDRLQFDLDFRGFAAGFRQLDELRARLGRTATNGRASINTLRQSLESINNVRVRTAFLSGLESQLNRARDVSRRTAQGIRNDFTNINGAAGRGSIAIGSFAGSLAAMGVAAAINGIRQLAHEFTEAADRATLMDAKLKLATQGWGSFNLAQADVARISRDTRSELTSTATLYGKLAQTGQTMNASQAQVARATQTVTSALKVSGASAQETTSTVLQLGQALSSGKLNGDEFRSLGENAPRLMKLLSDSMGVPRGALKKLAGEGKLTSDVLFKALNDPKFTAKLDEELKSIPKTFGDAGTAFTNVATSVFGAFNEGGQFSQALYDFADQGQTNMKSLAGYARDMGGEIRDSLAGLGTAFEPFLANGTSVFDALGIKVQSLRDQIAGLLGMMDSVANAPIRLQNWANNFDNKWFGTSKPIAPLQDMRGQFRVSYAQSRLNRSRDRLQTGIRDYEGDNSFSRAGMSDKDLMARFAKARAEADKRRGGTGVLRKPPGVGGGGSGSGSGASDAKALARHEKTLSDLQKLEQSATGSTLARIQKRIEREKAIVGNLRKGVGNAAATAAAGGAGGKSEEQREQERAAKKYADAVTDLKGRVADLALTEEQKALADEMERAGLGRDIKQTNEKAKAIRDLFVQLKEGEKAAKVTEVLKDFNEKTRELGYSEEQLAQVEARRRAGLSADLAVMDAQTAKVDAQASAYFRLQEAKANKQEVADFSRGQKEAMEDQAFNVLARNNPDLADDKRRAAQVERDRAANIEKITALKGITDEKRKELLANEDIIAKQETQAIAYDRQQASVEKISGFLTNLWDNPREAMRSFFRDMMKRLLEAILKAAILGDKLGGGGGIGGLFKQVVGGALGIGGGRATGGSVRAGDIRPVGENGPELVQFGAAGTVFNANATRSAMGGGGTTVTIGETHMNFHGNVTNETRAEMKAMMAQQQRDIANQIDARLSKRGIA